MGNRFTLQQFSGIFQVRNSDGIPYVLIGGQAVNYWAECYFAKEPELRKHAPFTSGDIDFRGNRDDVQIIAGQLKLPAVFPDKVSMTALAGAIPFQIGKQSSNIEIVRLIPGVSVTTVDAMAVGAELSGQQIRVLDPISLVLCKVNLALTGPAGKPPGCRASEDSGLLCARFFARRFAGGGKRQRSSQRVVGRGQQIVEAGQINSRSPGGQ